MCLSSFLFFLQLQPAAARAARPPHPAGRGRVQGLHHCAVYAHGGYFAAVFGQAGRHRGAHSGDGVWLAGVLCVRVFLPAGRSRSRGFWGCGCCTGSARASSPRARPPSLPTSCPLERRGEAMGLLGVTGSLGMAAGPAFGSWLADARSPSTPCFTAPAGRRCCRCWCRAPSPKRCPWPSGERFSLGAAEAELERGAGAAGAGAGPGHAAVPVSLRRGAHRDTRPKPAAGPHGLHQGPVLHLLHGGLAGGAAGGGQGLATRTGGCRCCAGRRACWPLGLALLVWSPSVPVFLLGAVVFGLGTGLNSPTLYAWTIDLSHPERRGRAVATMYIALEVGIGLGALLAGWIFGNQRRPPALRARPEPGCACWRPLAYLSAHARRHAPSWPPAWPSQSAADARAPKKWCSDR